MTKRIVSGIFILTALGALGVILAGALNSGEQLIVRFLTAVIVAALGLYVVSDLRLQADDAKGAANTGKRPRPADAPPNSTAAFMATVTRRGDDTKAEPALQPEAGALAGTTSAVPSVLASEDLTLGSPTGSPTGTPDTDADVAAEPGQPAESAPDLPALAASQAAAPPIPPGPTTTAMAGAAEQRWADDAWNGRSADHADEALETAEQAATENRYHDELEVSHEWPMPPLAADTANDPEATTIQPVAATTDTDDIKGAGSGEQVEPDEAAAVEDEPTDEPSAEEVGAAVAQLIASSGIGNDTAPTTTTTVDEAIIARGIVDRPTIERNHEEPVNIGEVSALPVAAQDAGLQAADYAGLPLAPIIDLRDVHYQAAGSVDVAIKAGEVEVIATLIEQGMLSTEGAISDRDVRTMVYVAFTSNELRKLLLAGGSPDRPNDDLDLGPVELFDERLLAPPPQRLYAGTVETEPEPEPAQIQLG